MAVDGVGRGIAIRQLVDLNKIHYRLYCRDYFITMQFFILAPSVTHPMTLEERTARPTRVIDPRKKAPFERLCVEEGTTPSQLVRRLIRIYIEERTGKPSTLGSQQVALSVAIPRV